MKLMFQNKFAELAGISAPAVSKAIREKRLECYHGTKKINRDCPLSKAFLNNISPQRMSSALEKNIKASDITYPGEESADNEGSDDVSQETKEDYGKQRTKLSKEQTIKLKLQNAQTRGELMQDSLVEEYLFLYLDKLHSTLDRMGSAALTDIGRKILTAGDIKPEHRQAWKDLVKGVVHGAKLEIMERLDDVKTLQAGGGR